MIIQTEQNSTQAANATLLSVKLRIIALNPLKYRNKF